MMKSIPVWKQELSDGVHAARLASLYCCTPAETASEAARYAAVLDGLEKTFGSHAEAGLYSAPGCQSAQPLPSARIHCGRT